MKRAFLTPATNGTPGEVIEVEAQTQQPAQQFAAPVAYWEPATNDASDTGALTPSTIEEYERERKSLIDSLPNLSRADRSRAETRIAAIEVALRRARAADESSRKNIERESERRREQGQPTSGNESTAVNFKTMSMADQTDVIQAAIAEIRRAGAGK